MTKDEYLDQRLQKQIDWYDKKSQLNQRWYKFLNIAEILFAVSIPFLVSFISSAQSLIKIIVGILGVAVAFISGLLGIYKFQENWIEYRTNAESLKHEKYLYLTKCEPYNSDDCFEKLVQRVESFISKEHSNWLQYMIKNRKENKHG